MSNNTALSDIGPGSHFMANTGSLFSIQAHSPDLPNDIHGHREMAI
jgi:hypothetical protein